ncbi:MAG: alpha-L-rhamnosidase [Polaribacter sp.]|jgi:alpha-L-rhamnosidase
MKFSILHILTFLFVFLLSLKAFCQSPFPDQLRCEYKVNPKGIEIQNPRLSWQLIAPAAERGLMQSGYQIQVATSLEKLKIGKEIFWDSREQQNDHSLHISYEGPKLDARQEYYWRVKIWDNKKRESSWSEAAYWEMGLMDTSQWKAKWIEVAFEEEEKAYNPCPMLRREHNLKSKIATARLYITSHGIYEVYLNGQRVGDELFTPGWTSYHKRLQYQIYNVTELLQSGENAMAVRLGDGWFRGQFDSRDRWNTLYGNKTALLFQLEVTYENGETETIISDENWKASTGAIVMSGLYDGEVYDARLEKSGWTKTGYDDSDWQAVRTAEHSKKRLVSTEGVPVRKMEEVQPIKIIRTPKEELVVDLGQNLVGWVRLKIKGKAKDTITLYHAEVLDKEGNFYTANLRTAAQKVQYILNDDEERIFEPHFTFQGFRYVKIEGISGEFSIDDITGVAIYSEMEKTGTFECSDSMINQLQSNIEWGQKGNFLDVPTDCPQRDERMGWTGDAQAFASTACFNFNTAAFYTKWLQDLKADQLENGSVPWVVPNVLRGHGSTGWGDAATIVPWTMYLKYGDIRILERQYDSMKKWVAYLEELSAGDFLVQEGRHFGDWLFFIHPTEWNVKPGHTDIDFLATAFFAYSTQLTMQTAKVLKNEEDVAYYSQLLSKVKKAFQEEFLTPSGRLSPHSQTAYTIALAFDLLPEAQKSKAVAYLVKDITDRKFHLSTGFLGTPHLCHVLSSNGHADVAFKLLFQKKYPSWLYPITKGATTIWERWDGIKPDGSFQNTRMNSFNHYAYGAIGDWMYRVIAGIEVDSKQPGYKHILIQPQPTKELSYAKATYQSLHGLIVSDWSYKEGRFYLDVILPPNTSASITLPKATLNEVLEGDTRIKSANGILESVQEGEDVIIELGSGSYQFSYPMIMK